MSYNISKKEQHQKKFKIENTSPPSVEHSGTEHYYMTPSIEQLNLAETGTKPMPSSLSTKSTSKQVSTPGRLCSISPTPTPNPGQGFVGEIKIPGGKIYYQKQIIIIFFEANFTNMYPVEMLFDAFDSQVGMLNPTWNEAVLKQKHAKNWDPKM